MNSYSSTLERFQNSRDDAFAAHVFGDMGSIFNFSKLPNEPLTDVPWAYYLAAF
jgi:hypothetical protein